MDHNEKMTANKSYYDPDTKVGGIDSIAPDDFECNRPFIFIIHEQKHNVILFIGKFMKPEKWIKKVTRQDILFYILHGDQSTDIAIENDD
jgi:hypothetical protein